MEYKIQYTGAYPDACGGALIISLNNKILFETIPDSFLSNGRCHIDSEGEEYVTPGKLELDKEELERLYVFCHGLTNGEKLFKDCMNVIDNFSGCCCGGCI